jgi:hypothetical protein
LAARQELEIMNHHVSLLVVGFCLLLGGCAGSGNASNDEGAAGSAGGDVGASFGGGSIAGATSSEGGVTSDSGGIIDSGGMGGLNASGGSDVSGENGGTTATGGANATGGSGAASGSGGTPMPIDYSIWQLQLPTGSGTNPTTISPSKLLTGYMDSYFYPGPDGGQMFMDPNTGITTSGSTRCRTELRESTTSGGQAAWHTTGTNTMTVTGKVVKGSAVTVAQVFDGGGGNTLCELQYNGKGFGLFYEESKGSGGNVPLNAPAPLNTKYSFTLSLSKGVLTVTINGKQVYTHAPGTANSTFYFKVGNYDQGTSAGPISTTAHSIVENYSVVVVHQ